MSIELLNMDCMTYMAGLPDAVINRMCKKGYKPHKTNARYFSDFARDAEWFINL